MSELNKYIIPGEQFQVQLKISKKEMIDILMNQWDGYSVIDLVVTLVKKWNNENFTNELIEKLSNC
ncbi:hypothetical protein KAR91_51720 [Candidatus Pacearchaeota archaeon]|nr:hypothetical protein [Candidatus Pacearchaeota archaeon]